MSSGYVISQTALQTILLHAYKYPSAATNGLLLAPAAAKAGGEVRAPHTRTLVAGHLERCRLCIHRGVTMAG